MPPTTIGSRPRDAIFVYDRTSEVTVAGGIEAFVGIRHVEQMVRNSAPILA